MSTMQTAWCWHSLYMVQEWQTIGTLRSKYWTEKHLHGIRRQKSIQMHPKGKKTKAKDDSSARTTSDSHDDHASFVEFASGPVSLSKEVACPHERSQVAQSSSSTTNPKVARSAGTSSSTSVRRAIHPLENVCPHCRKHFSNSWSIPKHVMVRIFI